MGEFDDVLDDFHFAVMEKNELQQQIANLVAALEVSKKMLDGECRHGYDTSLSARGCDECAEQIEQALVRVKEE